MSWLLLLKTFFFFLLKNWKSTVIAGLIVATVVYIHVLRTENQTLTGQVHTLTASNKQYATNEKTYQQDIRQQNQSILSLQAASKQQQDKLSAATVKASADYKAYVLTINKLRVERIPTSCHAVMNLMLQKATQHD